ncbi:MAG TPA: chlorophyll a/b-binding protein [Coleofasciculaceae cyanobacterium]
MASSTKVSASSDVDKVSPKKNRNGWVWGFTPQAELWNGRLAMLGFVFALFVELFSHQVALHF